MALVTFVIPSIDRPTLRRTLHSLKLQTDPSWKAIVVYDGVDGSVPAPDPRVRVFRSKQKLGRNHNHAAHVRNSAMPVVTTPWVAFVDDDDTVMSTYVASLRQDIQHHPDVQTVIFRMRYASGIIMPPWHHSMFQRRFVGISFAIRMDLWRAHGLAFEPSDCEDCDLLHRIYHLPHRPSMLMSSRVAYRVRHAVDPDCEDGEGGEGRPEHIIRAPR